MKDLYDDIIFALGFVGIAKQDKAHYNLNPFKEFPFTDKREINIKKEDVLIVEE